MEIAVAILVAIRDEEKRNGVPRKSRLQCVTYLNWRVLNTHLVKLEAKNLISKDDLRLTDKGLEFIHAYNRELQPVLKAFGF